MMTIANSSDIQQVQWCFGKVLIKLLLYHRYPLTYLKCQSGHEEFGSWCSLQLFQMLDQRNW